MPGHGQSGHLCELQQAADVAFPKIFRCQELSKNRFPKILQEIGLQDSEWLLDFAGFCCSGSCFGSFWNGSWCFVTYSTYSWGHSFHIFFENQAVDHQVVSGTVVVSPDGSEDSSSGLNMVFSWKKDAEPPFDVAASACPKTMFWSCFIGWCQAFMRNHFSAPVLVVCKHIHIHIGCMVQLVVFPTKYDHRHSIESQLWAKSPFSSVQLVSSVIFHH